MLLEAVRGAAAAAHCNLNPLCGLMSHISSSVFASGQECNPRNSLEPTSLSLFSPSQNSIHRSHQLPQSLNILTLRSINGAIGVGYPNRLHFSHQLAEPRPVRAQTSRGCARSVRQSPRILLLSPRTLPFSLQGFVCFNKVMEKFSFFVAFLTGLRIAGNYCGAGRGLQGRCSPHGLCVLQE